MVAMNVVDLQNVFSAYRVQGLLFKFLHFKALDVAIFCITPALDMNLYFVFADNGDGYPQET